MAPWVAFLALGCNLGFADDTAQSGVRNECSSDDDCGRGKCVGDMCRTYNTELGALLLYITPATGTDVIAGVGFTEVIEDFDFDSGPYGTEIVLGHVSRLQGPIRATSIDQENCVLDESLPLGVPNEDGSIAARLTLFPRARLLGVSSPSYTAELSESGASSYSFDLPVPPGTYDVYVEPQTSEAGCVRPPFLAVNQEIASGDVELGINLPQPEALDVRVRFPGGGNDLRGWTLEIIERTSGHRLSNLAVLGEAEKVEEGWEYHAALSFSEVEGAKTNPSSELVRLSPPADVVGPQIYVERSVVELFQGGDGLIDQLAELPLPVTFGARIASEGAVESVQSSVLFLATGLDSTGPGTVAAFSNSVETDEQGLFQIELLPGTYRVIVDPQDESLAPVETTVIVNEAETQAGRTIEIEPRTKVMGQLEDFGNHELADVSVVMSPAVVGTRASVLELAQGRQIFSPVATRVATGPEGEFTLLSDEGSFHLTARPNLSTDFPWFVRLNAEVGAGGLDLGALRVSLPVVISGFLTSQDTGSAVPEALIVAHAMLKDGEIVTDPTEATHVTPVGETRVDSEGHFTLVLPSSL